jgi:hypothetical protein
MVNWFVFDIGCGGNRMLDRFAFGLAAGLICLGVICGPALAQQATGSDEAVDVRARPRPDYDAVGGRVGSFLVFPKTELQEQYNDNIFATQTNTAGDLITVMSPSVAVRSDWNNHALNFRSNANVARHLDHSTEDYEDLFAGVDGRLDVLRSTAINGSASFARLHEDRGSPDAVNGKEPTKYMDFNAALTGSYQASRVLLSLGGTYEQLYYDNVATSAGTEIDNVQRNHGVGTLTGKVGYEIVRNYLAFLQTTVNQRNYEVTPDASGFNRDSTGYNIQAGSAFRISGITHGQVSVGYMNQEYKDSRFPPISGYSFNAGVTWNATELTTVYLNGGRSIQETIQIGASGYFDTNVALSVDHELMRNVILSGKLSYANDDYQGISLTYNYITAGLEGKYLINRNFYLGLGYTFLRRDASSAGQNYTSDAMMLRLGAQL